MQIKLWSGCKFVTDGSIDHRYRDVTGANTMTLMIKPDADLVQQARVEFEKARDEGRPFLVEWRTNPNSGPGLNTDDAGCGCGPVDCDPI